MATFSCLTDGLNGWFGRRGLCALRIPRRGRVCQGVLLVTYLPHVSVVPQIALQGAYVRVTISLWLPASRPRQTLLVVTRPSLPRPTCSICVTMLPSSGHEMTTLIVVSSPRHALLPQSRHVETDQRTLPGRMTCPVRVKSGAVPPVVYASRPCGTLFETVTLLTRSGSLNKRPVL